MSEQRFQQAKPIVDFPAAERAVMRFWEENRIFEKSLQRRQGAPKFVFNEGPPTANGLPHNGHVLTRVFKDVFLRYRTMAGKHVPRKAGWDTHGLPVEVEVEKELGIHGKEAIERYGVERFVRKCVDSVFAYTEEWERMTQRVGFWVDLSDAYVTFHKSYVESVWWALSRLLEKGLLYKGRKIVWWWPQGGTALSAGEVGLGYKTVEDPSVYVALPLDDDPAVSLLIWTTTPWTLPANQYVAVRPEYEYVQVKDGGRSLIVAAALRETIAQKLGRGLPVEKELKGADLLANATARRSLTSTMRSRTHRESSRTAGRSRTFGKSSRPTLSSSTPEPAWSTKRRRSARWTMTCTRRLPSGIAIPQRFRCCVRSGRTANLPRKSPTPPAKR